MARQAAAPATRTAALVRARQGKKDEFYTQLVDIEQELKHYRELPWGPLYNAHKDKKFDPEALEKRVSALMQDREITKPSGIYQYLLTGSERTLNLRAFDDRDKRGAYEKQKGICPVCTKHYKYEEMDGDHIEPWSKGGKTIPENCQMLCKRDNRLKSGY